MLQKVAEKSDWYSPRGPHPELGYIAIVERSGAFVAMVVEVKRINGSIKPTKIIAAIDCGTAVNPDIIKSQTEGCIVMGLTATYKSGLTIANGKVVEQNFDKYKILGVHESPAIDIYILLEAMKGRRALGEAGLPTVAP